MTRRNTLPKYERSIMHGHYLYSKKFNKTICVVRDGRDVLISYYHHLIIGNVRSQNDPLKRGRINSRIEKLGIQHPENVTENLAVFLDYIQSDYSKKLNGFTWAEFMSTYLEKDDVFLLKYEDMLADTPKALKGVLNFLNEPINDPAIQATVDKFSFKKQTNRAPGVENKNSFLRKGIAGDWKNHFNAESAQLFDTYYGYMLLKLGYEQNRDWLDQYQ